MDTRSFRTLNYRFAIFAAGLVGLAGAQTSTTLPPLQPQFSADERAQINTYWSSGSRYAVSELTAQTGQPAWIVHLTPDGSAWLWNYAKLRRTPGGVATPVQFDNWEGWIVKKLHYDRWKALQAARQANKDASGVDAPVPDKDTPATEPDSPGPVPPDLDATLGTPPVFAQPVLPKQYTIAFDDATIQYLDNVKLSNPRYAYYRFSDGVMSTGQHVKDVDPDRLSRLFQLAGCDASEAKVMRAVSVLEGGFDAVNTYDTGYVSVGFIQFASLKDGAGALGKLLLTYKQDDPTDFAADFHKYGIDVQPNGVLDVVDPVSGLEMLGSDANVRIIADKRLIAVFQRAGQKSDAFCGAQIKAAKQLFYPSEDPVAITTADGSTLTCKVSDLVKSEAGMATLFDRKVNTGNITALSKVASQVATTHHCASLSEVASYEREIVNNLKYRADFTVDPTLSQPGSDSRRRR